ncbi:MAG: hypothetical protein GDA43_08960 [Hormoscilla sp. SP5CHS1]|nr:hypothetical protein [Hormoscilla sp. SP12CHS1]MBC6453325.1 hypothetical protein [Hormoscilla sp. SP5CHS1]
MTFISASSGKDEKGLMAVLPDTAIVSISSESLISPGRTAKPGGHHTRTKEKISS